jgi:hypothetical protein
MSVLKFLDVSALKQSKVVQLSYIYRACSFKRIYIKHGMFTVLYHLCTFPFLTINNTVTGRRDISCGALKLQLFEKYVGVSYFR